MRILHETAINDIKSHEKQNKYEKREEVCGNHVTGRFFNANCNMVIILGYIIYLIWSDVLSP